MKVEDQEVGLPTPPKSEPRGLWTPHDVFCSSLFGPWNDLPCTDYLGQSALLRDLDRAISLFDTRIQHCDAGFRAWRERHKRAMEAGLAEIPGFPGLRKMRNGKAVWQDDVWEQRYQYLIHQRHQMILARFKSRFMLSPRQVDDFFGDEEAAPRETLKRRARGSYNRRPLALRCDWWYPLDILLERAADDWQMDAEEVKAQFWREGTAAPKLTGSAKRKPSEELVKVRVKREPSTSAAARSSSKAPLGVRTSTGEEKIEPYKTMDMAAMLGGKTAQGEVTSINLHPIEEQLSF